MPTRNRKYPTDVESDLVYSGGQLPEVTVNGYKPETHRTISEYLRRGYRILTDNPRPVAEIYPQISMDLKDVANRQGQRLYNAFAKPLNTIGIKPPRLNYDESDFSTPFHNYLDSVNVSQLDRKVPDWRERTANGDTVRIAVDGNDYMPMRNGTKVRFGHANSQKGTSGTT